MTAKRRPGRPELPPHDTDSAALMIELKALFAAPTWFILAKRLGISPASVSHYRSGRDIPLRKAAEWRRRGLEAQEQRKRRRKVFARPEKTIVPKSSGGVILE